MKKVNYFLLLVMVLAVATSCNQVSYKKTKTGLLYKIIPSDSKDSLVKNGQWLKIHFTQKINEDSVLQSTYGKMPIYQQLVENPALNYDPAEVFPLLKKGDSVVIVQFVDSLMAKQNNPGAQLPPYLKKGDKLTLYFTVLDVLKSDSAYENDVQKELVKDKPRQDKEQHEQMMKMRKEMVEMKAKEFAELKKTGEDVRQIKVVEDYLAKKNIKATKTGTGTYVVITQQGTGPKADVGKFLTVKYSGRLLRTDSVFQENTYPGLELGVGAVIGGWDEGLQLFNEGGKGTLYIPGFLAYGKNPPPNSPFKVDDPLIFDIEVVKVSDTAQ
jgi:FKBP-type peptidyl-prolyl cis-trans isomerase FkpA